MSNNEPTGADPPLEEELVAATGDEVFGKWGHRLRNFCGVVAVLSTCVMSLIYAVTIRESVISGHGWPDTITSGIFTCGPIFLSWAFMNVNKILGLILNSGDGRRNLKTKLQDGFKGFTQGSDRTDN